MPNYCEEPASLSEFHWLFSEELAEESLPLFIPRILSCQFVCLTALLLVTPLAAADPFPPFLLHSTTADRKLGNQATSPGRLLLFDLRRELGEISPTTTRRHRARTSIRERCLLFSIESGSAARNSSDPNSGPCPIPPPEALLSLRSATRKRHAEGTHEDDHRPQKYYRRSECQSSNIGYSSNSDASQSESQSRTPPSTASPALQFLRNTTSESSTCGSESRGANAIAELEASRTCVDFLLNEVRRVIDSGLGRQNPQKAQQIIRDTENRVQLFTRASRVTTQPSVHHTDSLPVFHSVLSEDLDPRNPHSYYFSQDSLAPAAGSQPTNPHSSQFAPLAGFHTFESIPSVGLEPSSSHSEMSRVPSECYVPTQSTSVLPQHRRSRDPSGSQLMQEWNHARLDSYINLYFVEPLPSVNTFQEPPQNLAQPYQMSTNVLI
ncbi:hypothetical protein PSTT_15159 [Puccinia striiformis]|uniref:Uncharacterized protein n=1 Tax=Puccinia striiformis TaxID=27350 RepID=A0A2S4UJ49_9BASI|nr:hypothetical protein PSTT_15159 [Puccinia striiformis]